MTVDIDRDKAAVYGITVDQIRNQLYNAFGTRQIGTIYTPANDYQVILECSRNSSRSTGRQICPRSI